MINTGLFFGSETGTTKRIALEIQDLLLGTPLALKDKPWDFAELEEKFTLDRMLAYELLIVGSPTWNIGELQADINEVFYLLDDLDFTGKKVAVYGCGDQDGYPDTYQDAMGIVGKKLEQQGAMIIGKTEVTDDYDFEGSQAVVDGKFIGLSIDEDNQSHLTTGRLKKWVAQLLTELK